MNNPDTYNKYLTVDERYTDLAELGGKTFAIVNEAEVKAFLVLMVQNLVSTSIARHSMNS